MPKKKSTAKHPCPLCGRELSVQMQFMSYYGETNTYLKLFVRVWCPWEKPHCGYEERTRGESRDEATIASLRDLAADFRGPGMFKHGKFEAGGVGINRRRRMGINSFAPIDPEEVKRGIK